MRATKFRPNESVTRVVYPALVIGIDPGAQTGYCELRKDSAGQLVIEIRTLNLFSTVELIQERYHPDATILVIENGGLNRPTFGDKIESRPGESIQAQAARVKAFQRISRNVGSANRESKLLIDKFKSLGYYVVEVRPVKRKLSKAEFEAETGFSLGRTNQHERDAVRLALSNKHLLSVRRLEYKAGL